jgi:hypothetical protein
LRVQKADEVRKQMSDCRHMARDCIVQHKLVIAAITRNTDTLKPASDAQSAAIDAARRTLRQERAKRNEKLASCKLVLPTMTRSQAIWIDYKSRCSPSG